MACLSNSLYDLVTNALFTMIAIRCAIPASVGGRLQRLGRQPDGLARQKRAAPESDGQRTLTPCRTALRLSGNKLPVLLRSGCPGRGYRATPERPRCRPAADGRRPGSGPPASCAGSGGGVLVIAPCQAARPACGTPSGIGRSVAAPLRGRARRGIRHLPQVTLRGPVR